MFGGDKNFLKIYRIATPNRYDFLHLDLQENPPKAYKNFETLIAIGGKIVHGDLEIKTETQEEMLQKLSTYRGLIFLPLIEDTCPRVVIEAKLLGLEIITNSNSQHIKEDWWKDKSIGDIEEYLKERPNFFWKIIHQLCNTYHGT